jgi:glycerol-3-phosphate dehydrogenase
VYGSDAAHIRSLGRESPALAEKVHPKLDLTAAEVLFHVRQEMARTVGDVLARRSRSLLLDAAASMSAAPRVAELMAPELHWPAEKTTHEIERFQRLAAGYLME